MIAIGDYWFCSDCTLFHCNGDVDDVGDERMREIVEGAEALPPNMVPDFDAESGDGFHEFASFGCDCCESPLAGAFYRFAELREESAG